MQYQRPTIHKLVPYKPVSQRGRTWHIATLPSCTLRKAVSSGVVLQAL